MLGAVLLAILLLKISCKNRAGAVFPPFKKTEESMKPTKIEWTDKTHNPVTGCTKISAGCKNCYMMKLQPRLTAMGNRRWKNGTVVTLHWDKLHEPLRWKKPQRIFVNSMSDFFHKDVLDEFIDTYFTEVIEKCPEHSFQILTKRAVRLSEYEPPHGYPNNAWMGVSVEDKAAKARIELLRGTSAKVKFLSIEPLLEDLGELDLRGIDWVIVGGESGPGFRVMDGDWVRKVRNQCVEQGVPFFFKQWSGFRVKKLGRMLDGCTWDEMPEVFND